jgi:hypothetical protein
MGNLVIGKLIKWLAGAGAVMIVCLFCFCR